MADANDLAEREQIRTLIAKSGRFLDRAAFDAYLGLYTEDGRYSLEARSEQIGRDMVWMRQTKPELATLFEEMPQHVRDKAHRTHLVATDEIEIAGNHAKAVSTFAVFRTTQVGETALYAVGSYEDELIVVDGAWKIASRVTRLETRSLVTPTPVPL